MKNATRLRELLVLCARMQRVIESVLAQVESPVRRPGMPDLVPGQRIERAIVAIWDDLRKKDKFTPKQVQQMVNQNPKTDSYVRRRAYSNFSAILSRWANRDSCLEIVE